MTPIAPAPCPVCGALSTVLSPGCATCGVQPIQLYEARVEPGQLNRPLIEERIIVFRKALNQNRDDQAAHYSLGIAYFNLDLLEDSAVELTKAVELMPDDPHLRLKLATILTRLGQRQAKGYIDRALAQLEHARRHDPNNAETLELRTHVLKFRLCFTNVNEVERLIAERQLTTSWNRLALIDPERAETLEPLLWVRAPTPPPVATGKWFWRTLGSAAVWFGALLVLFIAFAAQAENDDETDFGTLPGLMALIIFFAMLIVPTVVFVRGYERRGKHRRR